MGGTEDDGKFIRGNIARIRVKLENIKAKRMSNTLDGTFLFNPGGKNQEGEEERKIFRGIWIKLQIVVLCEIQLKRIVQRYRMIGHPIYFSEIEIRQSRIFLSRDYVLYIRVF